MSVFYRQAYEAACRGRIPRELTDLHFESWKPLDEALRLLPSDEQRSDAIYGDWLMQLNNPGWSERLTIKRLLIGSGALAANYLAELAQNANDAAEGEEAEVRIVLRENWLVFTNNGRKVTPDNQLGLCRFFKHVDPEKTADQVIGQFGVGFKSSFRIADEVFVQSWEGNARFAFRLAISTEDRPASWPDETTQRRVVQQLEAVGVRIAAHALARANAGFCTPEALPQLPSDAESLLSPLRSNHRGTAFCFHLHPEGVVEVAKRIQGQRSELDELCPLFLPFLRTVQIGPNELHMTDGRHLGADELPDLVRAIRITLTTKSHENGGASHSRFWRLEGIANGDLWQVALHADSEFRLRVDRAEDERGVSLKSGAAYAFFPLSDVVWPFRFHLHINLQPNLSRGDWNSALEPAVREQIRRAVGGTLRWLERFRSRHHPNWRVEQLVDQHPDLEPAWAKLVFERMSDELRDVPLLKTLWGVHHTSRDACTVRIVAVDAARKNWVEFCTKLTGLGLDAEFPLVHAQEEEADFGVPELPANKLKLFFLRAAEKDGADAVFWRAFVTAAFCAEALEPDALLAVCRNVPIERPDGPPAKLGDILIQPAGSTLTPAWHEQFHALANWLRDEQRGQHALCGRELREQLLKLAKPVFNPNWGELPVVLGTQEAWNREGQGEQFWRTDRPSCPAGQRSTVVHSLRIKDGSGTWKPVTEVWILGNEAPRCFHGVVKSWEPFTAWDFRRLAEIREKIRAWDLLDAWQDAVEARLRDKLGSKLGRELVKHSETTPGIIQVQGPFEEILDTGHKNSRDRLETRWQGVVKAAELSAMRVLLQCRGVELRAARLIAKDGIAAGLRSVLTFWGDYAPCPWWFTSNALKWLVEAGLWNPGQYSLLTAEDLTDNRCRELAQDLLAHYHKWAERTLTTEEAGAIQKLCESEPPTLRGNWIVGSSVQRREFVRNLLNPDAPTAIPTGAALNASLLKLAPVRWHSVQQLPEPLRRIPAIAQAAIQVATLELRIDMPGAIIPASRDEFDPEILADPLFASFETAANGRFAATTQPIDLEWRKGDQVVAELRKAPFVLRDGQLITHRVLRPADESQYNLVLANYGIAHLADAEFHAAYNDQGKPRAEVYEKFRPRILKNAKKQNVEEAGYRIEHIVRELLQNAESAYASKAGVLPVQRDFVFTFSPPSMSGASWQATCRHHGRAFNEPDNEPKERNDIAHIVSTPNEHSRETRDELGRFNRGFKSVFLVTEAVTVTSGRFKFSIRDLLLLHPPPPVPPRAQAVNYTEFVFDCTRDRAFKLAGLPVGDDVAHQRATTLFSPSSFVFLKHITLVRVSLKDWQWQWTLRRGTEADGWIPVEVAQSFPPAASRFVVFSGEKTEGQETLRYAAALRVDETGLPVELEKDSAKIHLTFPTDDVFPLGFLVNGDFVTDAGRQGVQLSAPANLQLIVASFSAVLDRLAREMESSWTKPKWLAWAKVLRLRRAREALTDRFPTHHDALLRQVDQAERLLFDHIPHGDAVNRLAMLEFPSKLLRRLAPKLAVGWGLNTAAWIDPEIEAQLPTESRPTVHDVSLGDFLNSLPEEHPVRSRIQADLNSSDVKELKLDAIERRELDHALQRLASVVFVHVAEQPTWSREPEPRTVRWLWEWWKPQQYLAAEYTLDGANLPLVCPAAGATRDDLVSNLRSPNSEPGKHAWYRLLGFACLMSAAFGNMERLRRFWRTELETRSFWEETSGKDFTETTRRLFGRLVEREFTNTVASGEDADYWRHVFYDVRKVHELVWQKEFADTVLRLAADPVRASGLVEFLRSGQIAGQRSWSGVLGQSAGSPLFFVVRELRRLDIIPHAELDRRAFFPCAPVRRAARQIGWIDRKLAQRSDFASLAEISERLYLKLTEDDEFKTKLLPYYDIPLLHLGLNS